jgi:nitrate/nitrite-specific signal transduction histidine kinase
MELRRELLLTVGALVVLSLSLAFGAIGLFVRMGPAIERILQENVYSIVAAERVLSEFVEAEGKPLSVAARREVLEAIDKAERNVTEPEEQGVLASLRRELPQAMDGDRAARHQVVSDVHSLIAVNRTAMNEADEEARRLGRAGAWSAVLIGFCSFLLSLFVLVRLQRRLVRPLVELCDVLESAGGTQRLRRCRRPDAPAEVIQVTEAVNRLLDERLRR